jgi:acetylornithine deacetylase/succinyl-diaminopimelate desuccinylase-like protein
VRLLLAFSDAPPAYGVDLNHSGKNYQRYFHAVEMSLEDAFGVRPLHLREGGSINVLSDFHTILGIDSLPIGVVPPESAIHAPNENWSETTLERTVRALTLFFSSI